MSETVTERPFYYETTDEHCNHHRCEGSAWFRLITWNGFSIDGFCPWHAADWERRGIAKLDRSLHTGSDQNE